MVRLLKGRSASCMSQAARRRAQKDLVLGPPRYQRPALFPGGLVGRPRRGGDRPGLSPAAASEQRYSLAAPLPQARGTPVPQPGSEAGLAWEQSRASQVFQFLLFSEHRRHFPERGFQRAPWTTCARAPPAPRSGQARLPCPRGLAAGCKRNASRTASPDFIW